MNTLPKLKESDIHRLASSESYSRGEDYYENGAVVSTIRRGNRIIAEVEGSQYEPYTVTITLDKGGLKDTDCTCPYDFGGICKHIVAVLLTYIHDQKTIVEKPEPENLIQDLNHDDLVSLFTRLLEIHPELLDWVESECEMKKTKTKKARSRKTTLDAAPFKKQVQHIFKRSKFYDSYYGLSDILHQLGGLRNQAMEFLNHDDGKNALTILITLVKEVYDHYEVIDDSDGDISDFLCTLGLPTKIFLAITVSGGYTQVIPSFHERRNHPAAVLYPNFSHYAAYDKGTRKPVQGGRLPGE